MFEFLKRKSKTTWFCDKGDFDESDLKILSIEKNWKIIIRGYAIIEDGYMRPINKVTA